MRFDRLSEEAKAERLAKLHDGARRAAARRRFERWARELEAAGYTVIPPGSEGATEPAEVCRIPA